MRLEVRVARLGGTLLLAALLIGCAASDRNITITDANKADVLDKVKDSKAFSVDEVRLIISRQMRVFAAEAIKQPPPAWVGQTLEQIIADERKFRDDAKAKEKETERLAAEAKAKEDAIAAELRKVITLTVYEKGFRPSNYRESSYRDLITIKLAYQNTPDKDVRAFTGQLKFTDLFDVEIYSSRITIENPIKAGDKATWTGSIEYNQFNDAEQRLAAAQLSNMKVVWLPQSIIFADGSKIGG
jgi:hypothetical protein